MSDQDERSEESERRAAELVRKLPAPRPDPSYRARLRREFVAGSLSPPRAVVEIPAEAPERRRLWDSMLMPAAATLVVWFGLLMNHGPGWEVLEVRGAGSIEVNGRTVGSSEREHLSRALRHGARLRLPEGASMTVVAPGRMAVEVAPGTAAVLSPPPARWLGRIASAEVSSGELRLTTGDRFPGSRLVVKTPEARVEVRGTTLAVIRELQGTCVCVMDGVVRVGEPGRPMVDVHAGRRRFLFRDGRPPVAEEMLPTERTRLGEMMERDPAR